MASITLTNISKAFGKKTIAVKDFSLSVSDREFLTIVGPSGCGKTTVLRFIAGLENPDAGNIAIGGKDMAGVQPKDRDIAMVFQNFALYPHLTVFDNIAFPLQVRGIPKEQAGKLVLEAAELLGLQGLLDRLPKKLSGGEKQRVALGRAIVRNPKAFLFDEPLGNLDIKLRTEMRMEIKRIHDKVQSTMVYVTHDQREALMMGDRVCVMRAGSVLQVGTPVNVYERPVNRYVAELIGTPLMQFIPGELVAEVGDLCFRANGVSLTVPEQRKQSLMSFAGKQVVLGVRPEHVALENPVLGNITDPGTRVQGTVELVESAGSEYYVYFRTSGKDRMAYRAELKDVRKAKEAVSVIIDPMKTHFFDPVTNTRL